FGTRAAKSRLNFLDLLRAGHTDFVLNEAAFSYMRARGLSAASIASLVEGGETRFVDQKTWQAHLGRLGIVSPKEPGLAVRLIPFTQVRLNVVFGLAECIGSTR